MKEDESKGTFKFLGLPPELRIVVYEYLLTPKAGIRYTRPPGGAHAIHTMSDLSVKLNKLHYDLHPNICRVNRLIHKEATHVLYNKNVFVSVHELTLSRSLHAWKIPFYNLTNAKLLQIQPSLSLVIKHPGREGGTRIIIHLEDIEGFSIALGNGLNYCFTRHPNPMLVSLYIIASHRAFEFKRPQTLGKLLEPFRALQVPESLVKVQVLSNKAYGTSIWQSITSRRLPPFNDPWLDEKRYHLSFKNHQAACEAMAAGESDRAYVLFSLLSYAVGVTPDRSRIESFSTAPVTLWEFNFRAFHVVTVFNRIVTRLVDRELTVNPSLYKTPSLKKELAFVGHRLPWLWGALGNEELSLVLIWLCVGEFVSKYWSHAAQWSEETSGSCNAKGIQSLFLWCIIHEMGIPTETHRNTMGAISSFMKSRDGGAVVGDQAKQREHMREKLIMQMPLKLLYPVRLQTEEQMRSILDLGKRMNQDCGKGPCSHTDGNQIYNIKLGDCSFIINEKSFDRVPWLIRKTRGDI